MEQSRAEQRGEERRGVEQRGEERRGEEMSGVERICFLSKGGAVFNTTISLMMMHDNKNRLQERTMTSRQKRRRGKYNGDEAGSLLR